MRQLTFIGTGYVGLVSGTCMAELGHKVTCVDVDAEKIALLKKGDIPIYEPDLKEMVARNVAEERLSFTTNLAECVPKSDAVFIAVGTPQSQSGQANLEYVFKAAEDIAPLLEGYTVVVTKSTVPVGANKQVKQVVLNTNPHANFDVASNPEFLREGFAVQDFSKPDRIIVGAETEKATRLMADLYAPQTCHGFPLLCSGLETAEMIKYAANTFLATKITFINQIATLCEASGADVAQVADGMGMDKRIGRKFLNVGPGYGGSCFPKDTYAMAHIAQSFNAPMSLVETTIAANQQIKERMAQKVAQALGGQVKGKTLAVLGLAFKENTDDMREAQSLTILPKLVEMGAKIVAHDPAAMPQAKPLLPQIELADTLEEATTGADAVLIITPWEVYKKMSLINLKEKMKTPLMVDFRNLFNPAQMASMGWEYHSLGRKTVGQDE